MKKYFLLLFFTNSILLSAQEISHIISPSPTTYVYNRQTGKMQQVNPKTAIKMHTEEEKIASIIPRASQSEVMIIAPETRAKDLQEAFEFLKKMSPASKLAVKLINGNTIFEILDMVLMQGGTMIIFRINSIQGQKFQVVKIEDIDTIIHA